MIPGDLVIAAKNLEERFRVLQAPTTIVSAAQWAALPQSVRDVIPSWLSEMLGKYSLIGGVLEYRDRSRHMTRMFSFFDPAKFSVHLEDGSLTYRLLEYGYVPFASESDGSVWVIPSEESTGPVLLLELADWDGGPPSHSNGLVFGAAQLAYLLVSMAVSDASFESRAGLPTRVMWYRGE